jgi:hypothetical protein
MLPMIYAPIAGDELPKVRFEPSLPLAANLDIWPSIAERAQAYWLEVAEHELISSGFAALAARNAASIGQVRKLLP